MPRLLRENNIGPRESEAERNPRGAPLINIFGPSDQEPIKNTLARKNDYACIADMYTETIRSGSVPTTHAGISPSLAHVWQAWRLVGSFARNGEVLTDLFRA
jgi:hypothetical protein